MDNIMNSSLTRTVLTLSQFAAQKLLHYSFDLAQERQMNLSIALADHSGVLLAFGRMDEAPVVTVDVAIGKARTAALLAAPSKVFEDMINAGHPSMTTVPGIVPLQGGVPLVSEKTLVGAVGVSGASGEEDQAIASLISEALNKL